MNSGELKRAKRDLRRQVLAARDAVAPAVRARWSRQVTDRFLSLAEVRAARTVLVFWSFGSELATEPLIAALHARGVRTGLPRIVHGELEVRAYAPGDDMTETSFGALEPAAGAVLDPPEIDVIGVPAVAFDRHGRRVGYGGGFYDRFLPRTRPEALRAGLGLGVQVLAPGEWVPAGPLDLPVDVIVTESETVRCPRRSGRGEPAGDPT